jgi:hypothetical protein
MRHPQLALALSSILITSAVAAGYGGGARYHPTLAKRHPKAEPYPEDRWATARERYFEVTPTGELLELEHDRMARVDLPDSARGRVRQIASDGRYLALLAGSGTIVVHDAEHRGPWNVIEEGRGTKQVAVADGTVWILKDNGKLWRWSFRDPGYEEVDPAQGTRRIVAVGRAVWILKDSGKLWRFQGGRFDELSNQAFVVGQERTRTGALHLVVRDGGRLFRVRPGDGNPRFATRDGLLYHLTPQGLVRFDPTTSRSQVLDPATDTRQVVVTQRCVYVLKANGNIWRGPREPQAFDWEKVDPGEGTRMIAAAGWDLWVLKDNGKLWQRPDRGQWTPVGDLGMGLDQRPLLATETVSPSSETVRVVATPEVLRVWAVHDTPRDAPAAPASSRMATQREAFRRLHGE